MSTTREEISEWFDLGVKEGATHMLIVCDTYDHDDYPVYIKPGQDPKVCSEQRNLGSMQRLMECYKLDPALKTSQLNSYRV